MGATRSPVTIVKAGLGCTFLISAMADDNNGQFASWPKRAKSDEESDIIAAHWAGSVAASLSTNAGLAVGLKWISDSQTNWAGVVDAPAEIDVQKSGNRSKRRVNSFQCAMAISKTTVPDVAISDCQQPALRSLSVDYFQMLTHFPLKFSLAAD